MKQIRQVGLWGDSVMRGVVWNSESQKYKYATVNAAEEASKNLGISLENHAKMGCTATKGFHLLQRSFEKESAYPQAALIEFGGNDCDFDWAAISDAPKAEHLPKNPLPKFEAEMRLMIRFLRERGVMPLLATLVPNHAERYFDFITRTGLSKENILFWLGDVQHIYRWHERYNLLVEKLAREEKCPILGLRDAFLSQWHYEDYLCEDGIHPNEKGYYLLQEVISSEGKRLLQF